MGDQEPLFFNRSDSHSSHCVAFDQGDDCFYIGFDPEATEQACRDGVASVDVAQLSLTDLDKVIQALQDFKNSLL